MPLVRIKLIIGIDKQKSKRGFISMENKKKNAVSDKLIVTHIFKNRDEEARKDRLIELLAQTISFQIKTDKITNR